jgi:MFS family permease
MAHPASTHPDVPQPEVPHRAMITVCAIGATLLQSLDRTIANVALPCMQGSFSASYDEITWVLTSYIVAAAIMTAPVGWMAMRFGRKPLYVGCIEFTALQVLAFATLSPSLRTEGASLFSLLRNIGAAIGVSVTSSVLARNTQIMHETIGSSVNPFNRALGFAHGWLDPLTHRGAALLDRTIAHQAQIVAYTNDYKMLILTTLPAIGLLLPMRRPKRA